MNIVERIWNSSSRLQLVRSQLFPRLHYYYCMLCAHLVVADGSQKLINSFVETNYYTVQSKALFTYNCQRTRVSVQCVLEALRITQCKPQQQQQPLDLLSYFADLRYPPATTVDHSLQPSLGCE